MQSELPKVLHRLGPRALLDHILEHMAILGIERPIVVVGHHKEQVMESARKTLPTVQFAIQEQLLGTADAVRRAVPLLKLDEPTYLIYGDNPLFSPTTFRSLLAVHERESAVLSLVTAILDDPARYGRIVRDSSGRVLKDVEYKDATEEEKAIKEINAGCYVADPAWLAEALPNIQPSPVTGEYYLTDLIEMAGSSGCLVASYQLPDFREALGVNTVDDLQAAEDVWSALQQCDI
jgi:bifunctional UDP-N-acetylglucosamine pyrophosphorylase/glucosamine-1-phosphate N-acetyltransferase